MTRMVFGLAALTAVLLLTGASPVLLLLLACPVMMLYMMNQMDHDKEK